MTGPRVIAAVANGWGRLTLNRPEALNALDLDMCRRMRRALEAWREDRAVGGVLIDHAGPRGFCAGGDIRMIAADAGAARAFFAEEYRLDATLFGYPKPVVAIMDGVTMGGGVGVSAPARYRVATSNTLWAMPETAIGLFPDAGGGWFLSRLPGATGAWLGLTGARLRAADCLALGLATHFVAPAPAKTLAAELIGASPQAVARVLRAAASAPGDAPLAPFRSEIDRLFCGERVATIITALERDGGEWARAQRATLRHKSPLSLEVTLRSLRLGREAASFEAELAREYRVATRLSAGADFREGVRAALVDRDGAPRWAPATLGEITAAQIDAIFAALPADEEWTPGGGLA